MPQATPLTDPILNTPWDPPERYWALDPKTNLATDELRRGRRPSTGRTLIPQPRKGDIQPHLSDAAVQPFGAINRLRETVGAWRAAGYPGAADRTRQLLEFWSSETGEIRPFFCQREAVETVVWLAEAGQIADQNTWSGIDGRLEEVNHRWNDGIPRLALKMATGSGKTVVMAMLMIWHAVNRGRPHDFLIIAPNLTVRDRLAELRSEHRDYLLPKLTPVQFQAALNRLRVTILNFQAFQAQNRLFVNGADDAASKQVRQVLRKGSDPRWQETPEEMIDRLLAGRRGSRELAVINDEAHHCYRMAAPAAGKASGEEKKEEQRAALWFTAIKTLHDQGRLKRVFDLSATPMYLRRPAELLTEHFPWTVSDYPLSDAIEAGLTKIPRVPIDDDASQADPVYRKIYDRTKPKSLDGARLQEPVRGLLDTMHEHYARSVEPEYRKSGVIPVMIAVANNIGNATQLFRWIAGYHDEQGRWHRGNLEAFSNVRADGSGYVEHPPTLLVHSQLGDSEGEGAAALKRIAEAQTEARGLQDLTKAEQIQAIRSIFNSVGRRGQPGERIRCIISVGMLTEGWDAKTVTHIFGFRKFSSQLLCEQVTGRALRRTSFEPDPETGKPRPEYANVFGVPYEFMRGAEMPPTPPPPTEPYTVEPLPGRGRLRITFPNLCGYSWSAPDPTAALDPDRVAPFDLLAPQNPSTSTVAGPIGSAVNLSGPAAARTRQNVIWQTAAEAVRCFEASETGRRSLFASMIRAVEDWLRHPGVNCPDERLWLLLEPPNNENAPRAVADAVVRSDAAEPRILPVFADQRDPMQPRLRSTDIQPFRTTLKPVYDPTTKSELDKAPCHSWLEYKVAQELDAHPWIEAWARNFRLGWTIPWRDPERNIWARYEPDFIARAKTADGQAGLHLIIEAKGKIFEDESMSAKREAVERQWIPAVENGVEGAGRWRYLYLSEDTPDIQAAISEAAHG